MCLRNLWIILIHCVASGGLGGTAIAVIGGAVGAVILFVVLVVLCVVILLVRCFHKKHAYSMDNYGVYDEPSSPSVPVSSGICMTTMKSDNRNYACISNDNTIHNSVIMESNPSYGITNSSTDSDVTIQLNPSYGVTKPIRKTNEDQYDYVQILYNPSVCHHKGNDTIEMEDNPSYGLTNSTAPQGTYHDVEIIPNPAYHSVTKSN